ncbi:hypothetical protein [Cupriavidus campinensis]|uniref:Uncharacterized protein n=1 Tax=Cupriavidus campinensis TaxID=151783 RepID=A0ABY3ESJ3_9BURK|nr:hypothetical protein [Cupriavidus campinensis]TSP13944.1 hypothetical protein FGG12_05570 [Cupriavidus campinensis]
MKKEKLQVTPVGKDFAPGETTDRRIGFLLGQTAATERVRYHEDEVASAEALEARGCVPFLKPTLGGEWVCIFDLDGEVHVTVPFKTEGAAMAAALHYHLESKSVMT